MPFLYNTDLHISILGRSRNLIIRELQRTNLDVNLAVNNLLSRDEEDGDDADDAQDNYVPEVIIYQALVCQHYKFKIRCIFVIETIITAKPISYHRTSYHS